MKFIETNFSENSLSGTTATDIFRLNKNIIIKKIDQLFLNVIYSISNLIYVCYIYFAAGPNNLSMIKRMSIFSDPHTPLEEK